jgi:hypothetical protein
MLYTEIKAYLLAIYSYLFFIKNSVTLLVHSSHINILCIFYNRKSSNIECVARECYESSVATNPCILAIPSPLLLVICTTYFFTCLDRAGMNICCQGRRYCCNLFNIMQVKLKSKGNKESEKLYLFLG